MKPPSSLPETPLVTVTLAPVLDIPEGVASFDTANGCYYHACGYLTSWFRRTDNGWQVTEWASYLAPEYTAALCDALASFKGEGIFRVISTP